MNKNKWKKKKIKWKKNNKKLILLIETFIRWNNAFVKKTKIMAPGPITSWQIDGETGNSDFILGAPKSLQVVTASMKLKDTCSLEEKLWPT